MRMYGMITKTHDIPSNPSLHIIFSIHVQNNMYTIFIKNNIPTSDTLHVYLPIQYDFGSPRFWKYITNTVNIDKDRYTIAGKHKFFNPGNSLIL